MKLKLVKEYEYNGELLPIDSIIEVEDEVQAQGLIESGIATAYTEEVEVEEEVEAIKECAKSINTEVETKSLQVKETENMNMFGKSIKDAIATKAVTTYASTEATQPLGIVSLEAGLAGMARKQPITGNLNIVYSATETTTGNLPVLGIVGECTTADTDTDLTQYSAIPGKWFATVCIPSEYLEDVPAMEAFVSQELQNKANLVMDNSIINGAFGSNIGLKGVITSTDSIDVGSVVLSAITALNLHTVVDSILPELQAKAVWVIAPATWSQLKASFLDVDNVNNQLITDGTNKTLLGYPVKVSVVMPSATPIVFGDFSQYLIGVNREVMISADRSAGFLTDSVPVKVAFRLAGGPACSKKVYNGATYAAFAYISA